MDPVTILDLTPRADEMPHPDDFVEVQGTTGGTGRARAGHFRSIVLGDGGTIEGFEDDIIVNSVGFRFANGGTAFSAPFDAGIYFGSQQLVKHPNNVGGTITLPPGPGELARRQDLDAVGASRQALLGWGYSDGASSLRRIWWDMGTAGNLTGSPLSMVGFVYQVPTVDPAAHAALWQFSNTSISTGADTGNNITGLWHATDGTLQLRIGSDGSNRVAWSILGWRAANAGKTVRFDFVSAANTATFPAVYQDGVLLTGWIKTVAVGTEPNWQSPTSGGAWLLQGGGLPASAFRPAKPLNRIVTQAEILAMIQTGALLPTDRMGGATQNLIAGNEYSFAGPVFQWFAAGGGGGASCTPDAANSELDCVLAANTANYVQWQTANATRPRAGGRYRVRFTIRNLSLIGAGQVRILSSGTGATGLNSAILGDGTYEIEYIATGSDSHTGFLFVGVSTGSGFAGATFSIFQPSFVPVGAVFQDEITRTAQVLDHGPNRIRGLMTAGVRPLCDRDPVPIRGSIAATGNILGLGASDPLWFEPALIKRIRVKPTASASTTITARLNTSGGTTIGTVTTSTLNQWVDLPFSDGSAFEVNAGDKLHLTTSAAFDFEINWSRR